MYTGRYDSPLGEIFLAGTDTVLSGAWFVGQTYFASSLPPDASERDTGPILETKRWLEVYFSGRDPAFLPPLAPAGSPFRREVWDILLTIPYGTTMTYGDIAGQLAENRGCSKMSAQAVGGAVGHNPISILIPCHRVIGADGSLTGYAGGIEKKRVLLTLEGIMLSPPETVPGEQQQKERALCTAVGTAFSIPSAFRLRNSTKSTDTPKFSL